MCKKEILEKYLSENKNQYSRLLYAGDGGNDFCPLYVMNENDLMFARKGYALEKKISKTQKGEMKEKIKAEIFSWNDAIEILNKIK